MTVSTAVAWTLLAAIATWVIRVAYVVIFRGGDRNA